MIIKTRFELLIFTFLLLISSTIPSSSQEVAPSSQKVTPSDTQINSAESQPATDLDVSSGSQNVIGNEIIPVDQLRPAKGIKKSSTMQTTNTIHTSSTSGSLKDVDGYASKYIDTVKKKSSANDLVGVT